MLVAVAHYSMFRVFPSYFCSGNYQVMLTHDKKMAQKRGDKPHAGYVPRAEHPLMVRAEEDKDEQQSPAATTVTTAAAAAIP